MKFLIYAVILILLLILIKETFEKLHAITVIVFFFILLYFLLSMLAIPFTEQLLTYVQSVPYVPQLVYSALFYQIGLFFQSLFDEKEYETFGELVMFSIRIVLLFYWTSEFAKVLSDFSSILEKLQ
ncbi:hypothetical protein ACH0B5_07400 [Ureibacillus sp. 179-F W5.1 NHS]|uniref:Uncharacterized protein n=1 Tax=Lysinibacillus halotolerans TaxID=1368476 RepID=A0A3M8HA43_9BACI|nr:hypothetical protein [Lysinibacillus halotolerans]RNC99199.1 hypothetical protein EC501_08500 [Lysinibacillus halotolerans]